MLFFVGNFLPAGQACHFAPMSPRFGPTVIHPLNCVVLGRVWGKPKIQERHSLLEPNRHGSLMIGGFYWKALARNIGVPSCGFKIRAFWVSSAPLWDDVGMSCRKVQVSSRVTGCMTFELLWTVISGSCSMSLCNEPWGEKAQRRYDVGICQCMQSRYVFTLFISPSPMYFHIIALHISQLTICTSLGILQPF